MSSKASTAQAASGKRARNQRGMCRSQNPLLDVAVSIGWGPFADVLRIRALPFGVSCFLNFHIPCSKYHLPYTVYFICHVTYAVLGPLTCGNSHIPCTLYNIPYTIYSLASTIYHLLLETATYHVLYVMCHIAYALHHSLYAILRPLILEAPMFVTVSLACV